MDHNINAAYITKYGYGRQSLPQSKLDESEGQSSRHLSPVSVVK